MTCLVKSGLCTESSGIETNNMKRRDFLTLSSTLLLLLPVGCAVSKGDASVAREQLDTHQTQTLLRFIRLLFPHQNIGNKPYVLVLTTLEEKTSVPQVLAELESGVNLLDRSRSGAWLDLPEEKQIAVMKDIENTNFFRLIYADSMEGLYRNKDVWKAIGYQGSSVEKGGYLTRGFDDINWLVEA